MKAIVQDAYGSSEVLHFREVEQPVIADDEVLVRVLATGLHMGDWHMMTGTPTVMRLATGFSSPNQGIRGMDVAGRVEAVGKTVTEFKPGDEVFGTCAGALAEFARSRADNLLLKPSNLSFAEAAAVPTSAITAVHALRDEGKLQPGQRVLIIGAAGGVGIFAVQLAKVMGAQVTGVCSTTKVELVRSLGADEVIDYTRERFEDMPARYELIVDCAGNRDLAELRRVLTPEGTLVIVGGEGGGRMFGRLDRGLTALMLSPFVKQRLRMLMSIFRKADLQFLKELLEAGKVRPLIDSTFPLEQGREALRLLEEGRAKGKIVVTSPLS